MLPPDYKTGTVSLTARSQQSKLSAPRSSDHLGSRSTRRPDQAFLFPPGASVHGSVQSKQRDATSRDCFTSRGQPTVQRRIASLLRPDISGHLRLAKEPSETRRRERDLPSEPAWPRSGRPPSQDRPPDCVPQPCSRQHGMRVCEGVCDVNKTTRTTPRLCGDAVKLRA